MSQFILITNSFVEKLWLVIQHILDTGVCTLLHGGQMLTIQTYHWPPHLVQRMIWIALS